MRLKRLELQGFKSFLDRTILTFQNGVTGVVGPNGCGKSNIVDAIMWVMGEQSPSHLRGENMTDVIFAGSEHRAPTSMAEVSLILDRQGVALSPQFASFDKGEEIAVTRRIYRDGTGEFLINKSACRLKDIHELFMDTGVGKRAYSIIQQGQIDRMINAKPEDRRLIFEEVAGITKYKAKRKEAEKKLEATRENLTRLHDIIIELEKQIRSLKIQATRARKYKELKGELEVADLYLIGRNLYRLRKTIDELVVKRDELNAKRAESDALYSQRDAEVTELDIKRVDQEKLHEQLYAQERDLALRIQKLEGQINILKQRNANLVEQNERSLEEEAELETQLESLHQEKESLETERDTWGERLQAIDDEIRSREETLRAEQDKRNKANSRKDVAQHRRNQNAQQTVALENKRESAESRAQEAAEAQGRIDAQCAETRQTIEQLRVQLEEAVARIDACAAKKTEAEAQVVSANEGLKQFSAKLSEMETMLFKAREAYHTQNSRLKSLEELQKNLEGYSSSARELVTKLEEHGIQALPLAEVIQPEAEIEEHLEMLLGEDMNTLLVKSSEDAERLARIVHEKSLERVRVLPLSEINEMIFHPAGEVPGAVSLLSKVRVQPGYEAAARWWLGDAVICKDADTLFVLRHQHAGTTIVSQDTWTIGHADRTVSAGATPTKTGVFARRREIEELTKACKVAEEALAKATAEREALLQSLQDQEKLQAELKDQLSNVHIESVECRKEKEKVQIELSRAERDLESQSRDSQRFTQQVEDLRRQAETYASELTRLVSEREQFEADLQTVEAEINEAVQNVEKLNAEINERKISRSAQQERASSIDSRLLKVESDISGATRRRTSLQTTREQNEAELAGFDESVAGVVAEQEEAQKLLTETQVQLSDTKAALEETHERLRTFRDDLHMLQKSRDVVMKELNDVELKLQQEQNSFEHLKGLSMERYQREAVPLHEATPLDMNQLPLFAENFSESWGAMSEEDRHRLLSEHVQNVRDKVSRYGEVNLTAISEFDEVQKRFDFLSEQKTDLENSIKILEEAIFKIDESTKARFSETFEAVQKKFGEIFPILFGGGKGELVLTNPENMLESGVDIMVQPPGKRLQSISLLSGGEKAMTAVSLVLAIFARKPSPFCLLDEVDAPLDDANVSRFNTVIRKMSEKTQFIVVTHNKKTMEIAEALYGVTMEKAGVSKMTSVRLQ